MTAINLLLHKFLPSHGWHWDTRVIAKSKYITILHKITRNADDDWRRHTYLCTIIYLHISTYIYRNHNLNWQDIRKHNPPANSNMSKCLSTQFYTVWCVKKTNSNLVPIRYRRIHANSNIKIPFVWGHQKSI